MVRRSGLAAAVVLACAPGLCAQVVTGDVTAIGFRASLTNGSGLVARAGQWTPVQVQLRTQGSEHFQGQLRVEAADLDGDLVSYVESPVTVTAGAGIRLAWCYAVWLAEPGASTLDVLTADGAVVSRLPLPLFDLIGNDVMLILDVSAKPVVKLRLLETGGWTPLDRAYGQRPYYRNVLIAAMPAAELPDRWIGLESVDVLVWDEPNPAVLSVAQVGALKQWVAQGGQLVVGLGKSWPLVQKSELAELLPVQAAAAGPDGTLPPASVETARLEEFFRSFVEPGYQRDREAAARTFSAPMSIATVEARPGVFRSVRTLVPGAPTIDLIADRWVGSGRVVAVAASVRELTQVPVQDAFYAQLFDLNPTTKEFRDHESKAMTLTFGAETQHLYAAVVQPTSFRGWGGVLVVAALAFVVMYIGLATLISWGWLRRHRLTALSWTVFAVFAVVASTISLGTVGVMHGLQRGVHAFHLVDTEAGSRRACARSYFGYSSASRLPVNLSLPGEGGFLRPLARGPSPCGTYATPRRYVARVHKALLENAPRRATLKQFEGFSQGELTGTLRADLTADRQTGQVTPGSWILNEWDYDVLGGYLLFIDPRFQDDDYPTRAAGKTTNWHKRNAVPPGLNVLAVWVPPIRAGERVSGLGQGQYGAVADAQGKWNLRANRRFKDMPDLLTLWDEQQAWVGFGARTPLRLIDRTPRAGLDAHATAALLASTRAYYLHCEETFENATQRPVSTDGLMNCDVSHWLIQGLVKAPTDESPDALVGQGILLLLVDDPGLNRLHADGQPLGPVSGRSLYRVRVPITFTGHPPRDLPVEGAP